MHRHLRTLSHLAKRARDTAGHLCERTTVLIASAWRRHNDLMRADLAYADAIVDAIATLARQASVQRFLLALLAAVVRIWSVLHERSRHLGGPSYDDPDGYSY